MTDLSALIARLEATEVGSRELDAAVYDQLFPRLTRDGKAVAGFPGRWPFHPGSAHDAEVRIVTTSLDAALALAERVLVERGPININVCLAGSAQAQIYPVDPCGPHEQAVAATPALALVIAILRAKQGER